MLCGGAAGACGWSVYRSSRSSKCRFFAFAFDVCRCRGHIKIRTMTGQSVWPEDNSRLLPLARKQSQASVDSGATRHIHEHSANLRISRICTLVTQTTLQAPALYRFTSTQLWQFGRRRVDLQAGRASNDGLYREPGQAALRGVRTSVLVARSNIS